MIAEIIKHAKSDIEYVDGLEAHLDEGGATSATNVRDLIAMVRWNAERVVAAPDLFEALDKSLEAMLPLARYYELNDQRDGNLEVPVRELAAVLKATGGALRVLAKARGDAWNTRAPDFVRDNIALREALEAMRVALEKAAPFIGWASTRGQVLAGVHADDKLCDEIDAALSQAESVK